VNTQDNVFSDPGDGGGGYADKAMALADTNINYDDPSDNLDGDKWGKAVQSLRDMGYDIPHYIPDVGSKKRNDEGAYEQTPNWAMKQAALLFDVCDESDFIEEVTDTGESFLRLSSEHFAETMEILQAEYGYTVIEDDQDTTHNTSSGTSQPTTTEENENNNVANMDAVLGESHSKTTDNNNGDDTETTGNTTETEESITNKPVSIGDDIENPDRYAVAEFVDRQCRISPNEDDIKTRTSTVLDAFTMWVNEHNIAAELDELSPDRYDGGRSNKLKTEFKQQFGVENSRRRMGDSKPTCFTGVELTTDSV
jgi:hypothetical protein